MDRLDHDGRGARPGGAAGKDRPQPRLEVVERDAPERDAPERDAPERGRGVAVLKADQAVPAGAPRLRVAMQVRKRIVLIAHDNRKGDLLEWARFNRGTLAAHQLFATGTTGALIDEALDLRVERFLSGPLGGDQQVGAGIAEGRLDLVVFFWDPLQPQPHDVDVKALLRIAVVHNCPIACNRATADFMLSSHLMQEAYERIVEAHERFAS